ncbi:hypothetical protein K505DRAFT_301587 [Melanomma pulvis-pyrius CBS 109.77]|uniref:DUF7580 domain-containing protein n=1 Tax=Melanomma pulvis-pyrius CBS 109.77 TaxID=1314802 RepID=A0A6A6XI07_9PLEO|nr:hypothetical protein K505DRAFT_301587 [Melanomma pulvis-pyrius CBS 109.77]
MSGFEIAGVILGVLPLVIGALSEYKQGKGIWASLRKTRGLLDDLMHLLKTQRTSFYLDILELLREARVPEILEDGDPTEEKCADILHHAKTGIQVEKYLGHLYDQFLEMLGYYEKYLKVITSKLKNITRPENANDLVALTLAKKSLNAPLALKSRVKFSMDRESLNALVKDLSTERYSLGKLIRRVKSKREWEAHEPTTSSTILTLQFARVRESATLLYQAACKCGACDRHSLHTVMLRLDHRLPTDSEQVARPALIAFRLCFPIEEAALQEIEVTACAVQPSLTKTGTLKVPAIIVTETSEESNQAIARVRIKSICDDARKAQDQGRLLTLELISDTLELLEEGNRTQQSYNASKTLAEFLRDTAQEEDARMSPMVQTLLALNVVSSVLQLRPTMWYNSCWDSMSIKFPTKAINGRHTVVCTPYVEQTVDAGLLQSQASLPVLNTEAVKKTMLELAILLLEILHHMSIETWAAKNEEGSTQTYRDRNCVATRWLELSTDKLLPPHVKAIEGCLLFCARSKLVWDDHLERLYCENIVKPLQQLAL